MTVMLSIRRVEKHFIDFRSIGRLAGNVKKHGRLSKDEIAGHSAWNERKKDCAMSAFVLQQLLH